MSSVLVPMDGAPLAERALPLAARIARASGAQLRLFEAISLPMEAPLAVPYVGRDTVQAGAEEYLQGQATYVGASSRLPVTTAVAFGPAPSVIVRDAQVNAVSHIVMTTHGRAGLSRAVLGSVAEQVLRESPVPVFLLPAAAAPGREERPINHILLPVDGSVLSHAVVLPVAALARSLGAVVTLLRVYEHAAENPGEELKQYVAELRNAAAEVNDLTVVGSNAAEKIIRMATVIQADMIAMATHGRSGLDRLAHGSVTEQVLRHSGLPLLTFGKVALKALLPEAQTASDSKLQPYGSGHFALA